MTNILEVEMQEVTNIVSLEAGRPFSLLQRASMQQPALDKFSVVLFGDLAKTPDSDLPDLPVTWVRYGQDTADCEQCRRAQFI